MPAACAPTLTKGSDPGLRRCRSAIASVRFQLEYFLLSRSLHCSRSVRNGPDNLNLGFDHAEAATIKGQPIVDKLLRRAGYDQRFTGRIEQQALNAFGQPDMFGLARFTAERNQCTVHEAHCQAFPLQNPEPLPLPGRPPCSPRSQKGFVRWTCRETLVPTVILFARRERIVGAEFTSITAHLTSRQDLVISAVKKSIPAVCSRKHRAIASTIRLLST